MAAISSFFAITKYYYYYYYYWCKLDIRGKVCICNVQPITRQYTIYYIRTQVTYKTYGGTQVKYIVYRASDPKDIQSTWKKEWTRNKQTNIKAIWKVERCEPVIEKNLNYRTHQKSCCLDLRSATFFNHDSMKIPGTQPWPKRSYRPPP